MLIFRLLLMNNEFGSWQEWLTVFTYLGFTVFIIWRVFSTEKN
ncbi:hypothetical protein [uncultured Nostoc sp.]